MTNNERLFRISLVWTPSRRVVYGKKTWTYAKAFYTYDRDKAFQMNRDLRGDRYGPRVHLCAVRPLGNEVLDTWIKSRSRNGRVQKGWR